LNLRKGTEGKCIISVRDEGCGIPEDILPRLGEPFYTLKEKGTGLGLLLCRTFIALMNGKISAGVNPAGGSFFKILLGK